MRAGVLALQGAFREHRETLESLGVVVTDVRAPEHLEDIDALVIPGGESTTMHHLMDSAGLVAPIVGAAALVSFGPLEERRSSGRVDQR